MRFTKLNYCPYLLSSQIISAVDIANGLKNLAAGLPGNASHLLQQNEQRSTTVAESIGQTETPIDRGLRAQVESIIEKYLSDYYQPNP